MENNWSHNQTELDEGIMDSAKSVFNKFAGWFKKRYKASKVALTKIKNRHFVLLFSGKAKGAAINGRKVLDTLTTNYAEGGKAHIISVMGGAKIKSSVPTNEGNFFDRLGGQILNEEGQEGIDLDKENADDFITNSRAEAYKQVLGFAARMGATKLPTEQDLEKVNPSGKPAGVVSADELMALIERLGFQLEFRTSFDQFIPSLLVYGVPGEGKTYITERMAKTLGMKKQVIEVAAVYTEIFGGMPTSDDKTVWVDDETGEVVPEPEDWKDTPSNTQMKFTSKKEESTLGYYGNGMVLIESEVGDIAGWKTDIETATLKYNLVQKALTGNINEEEMNSDLLKVQATELRRALTGAPIPKEIKEMDEYSIYNSRLITEAVHKEVRRKISLKQVEGVLPPHKDSKPWMLILDEFNRNKQNMSAVMNLLLSGKIGDIYVLPLKTVVVASGNLGGEIDQQGDGENVEEMSQAMLTRFNFAVKLQTSAEDKAKFFADQGGKDMISTQSDEVKNGLDKDRKKGRTFGSGTTDDEFKKKKAADAKKASDAKKKNSKGSKIDLSDPDYKLSDYNSDDESMSFVSKMELPTAWINLTTARQSLNKKDGGSYTPIRLDGFQDGSIVAINSRLIETVGRNLMYAAAEDWMKNDLVGEHDMEWYEKNYKKEKFPSYNTKTKSYEDADMRSPQNFYLQVNQMHPRYLKIINASLLASGESVLRDLVRAAKDTKREGEIGDAKSILTGYIFQIEKRSGNEDKMKQLTDVVKGAKNVIKNQIANELFKLSKKANYAADLPKGWNSPDIFGDAPPMAFIATNMVKFLFDAGVGEDEIFGVANDIIKIYTSEAVTKAEKIKVEKDGKTVEVNPSVKFFDELLSLLINNELFEDALKQLEGQGSVDDAEFGDSSLLGVFDKKEESLGLDLFRSKLLNEAKYSVASLKNNPMAKKFDKAFNEVIEMSLTGLLTAEPKHRKAIANYITTRRKKGMKPLQLAISTIRAARKNDVLKKYVTKRTKKSDNVKDESVNITKDILDEFLETL